MSILSTKHFIGLEQANKKDIQTLIDVCYMFKEVLDRPIKKVPSLTGINIANLFRKTRVDVPRNSTDGYHGDWGHC